MKWILCKCVVSCQVLRYSHKSKDTSPLDLDTQPLSLSYAHTLSVSSVGGQCHRWLVFVLNKFYFCTNEYWCSHMDEICFGSVRLTRSTGHTGSQPAGPSVLWVLPTFLHYSEHSCAVIWISVCTAEVTGVLHQSPVLQSKFSTPRMTFFC